MSKKQKLKVAEAGSAPALAHNPFAALAGASAPARAVADATAPAPAEPKPRRDRLVLRRETKHRAGKGVVIVAGLRVQPGFDDAAIRELAQQLKQQLACGGTVERTPEADAREIVLQGDQPARVAELLRARGFRVSGVTA